MQSFELVLTYGDNALAGAGRRIVFTRALSTVEYAIMVKLM